MARERVESRRVTGVIPGRPRGVAQKFADAGLDHLVAMNAEPDPDGFMDFVARELTEPLRNLKASDRS